MRGAALLSCGTVSQDHNRFSRTLSKLLQEIADRISNHRRRKHEELLLDVMTREIAFTRNHDPGAVFFPARHLERVSGLSHRTFQRAVARLVAAHRLYVSFAGYSLEPPIWTDPERLHRAG